MGQAQRMFLIFLPAVTDVILTALDFLIFTASAHADNVAVRESIVKRGSIVNRTSVWCVTITDERVTIAENEATRLGIDQPLDNRHLGLWVSVFFLFVCMCPREANPGGSQERQRRYLMAKVAQANENLRKFDERIPTDTRETSRVRS